MGAALTITFLLARLHHARLRELVAGYGIPAELVPEPRIIQCPRCGDEFFADIDPAGDEPRWLEEDEWEALVRLDGECPDHAHRFAVGG